MRLGPQRSAIGDPSKESWWTSGTPWIWLNAMAVGVGVAAVAGLLGLIATRGLAHFWPADVAMLRLTDGTTVIGELVDIEHIDPTSFEQTDDSGTEPIERWLVKTGNRRVNGPDFHWVGAGNIIARTFPRDVAVFERTEWGNGCGHIWAVYEKDALVVTGAGTWEELQSRLARVAALREEIASTQATTIGTVNYKLERLRLEKRRRVLRGNAPQPAPSASSLSCEGCPPRAPRLKAPARPGSSTMKQPTPVASAPDRRLFPASFEAPDIAAQERLLKAAYQEAETQLRALSEAMRRDVVEIVIMDGRRVMQPLSDVIRVWRPNAMSVSDKLLHYARSWSVFLTGEPREANTEGGVFPAIFGTVMMVLLMAVIVSPLGVIAAVYLREYARQGLLVRLIRIAVNNLAGVPSIVYGVFSLGFFVYLVGGTIDDLFFAQAQPAPTFGTPGLIWASLTLALLTMPVVIVSTEEGLTRIPRAIREGSLALGATKAETLFRLALPVASPSILTGIILAVARAAGEVAPLMLLGVVKLAPALPVDFNPPFVHLERKFMHLGFHIYDVGFQSPNVEAARPLVYATALLLIFIVIVLNLAAITLRSRLEKRYRIVEA